MVAESVKSPDPSSMDDITTLKDDEKKVYDYMWDYNALNIELHEFLKSLDGDDPQVAYMKFEERGGTCFDSTYNALLKVKAARISVGADYVNIIAHLETLLNKGGKITDKDPLSDDDAKMIKKLLDFLEQAEDDECLDKSAVGIIANGAKSISEILGADSGKDENECIKNIKDSMKKYWNVPENKKDDDFGSLQQEMKECYDGVDKMNQAAGSNRQTLQSEISLLTNYDKEFLSMYDAILKQHNNLVSGMLQNKAG